MKLPEELRYLDTWKEYAHYEAIVRYCAKSYETWRQLNHWKAGSSDRWLLSTFDIEPEASSETPMEPPNESVLEIINRGKRNAIIAMDSAAAELCIHYRQELSAAQDEIAARISQLERGEYICKKCGRRKDGEHEQGDF